MALASDPDLLVLHGLRLKSLVSVDTVADLVDLPAAEVADRLDAFTEKGWARYRDGVLSGWSLTPAGRVEGVGRLADELTATAFRPEVEAAYTGFLALNQRFLQVCTDWQLRPATGGSGPELNDHTDADYDEKVIAELRAVDGPVHEVCTDLADLLDRFRHYGDRFSRALSHVEAGDTDWFTRPVLDSYHTVWFELHEDLLATLGIERSRSAGGARGDQDTNP